LRVCANLISNFPHNADPSSDSMPNFLVKPETLLNEMCVPAICK